MKFNLECPSGANTLSIETLFAFILPGGQVHFQPLFQSASSLSEASCSFSGIQTEHCALDSPITRFCPPCPRRLGCTAGPLPLCLSEVHILTGCMCISVSQTTSRKPTLSLVFTSLARFYLLFKWIATPGLSSKPRKGRVCGI